MDFVLYELDDDGRCVLVDTHPICDVMILPLHPPLP